MTQFWAVILCLPGLVLLKTLFPTWDTLSDAVSPCAVCAALAENSREDKRELRKKAEEDSEKVPRQPIYCRKPQLLTSQAGATQTYARECAEWKHGDS